MPAGGPKWDEARLAHTAGVRRQIMACIQRQNGREAKALERAVLQQGTSPLPRPHLRRQIREWYRERWLYLLGEYEKVLPHVSELPEEIANRIVRQHMIELAQELPQR